MSHSGKLKFNFIFKTSGQNAILRTNVPILFNTIYNIKELSNCGIRVIEEVG